MSPFVPATLHCTFALVGDQLGVILRVAMIWSDFLNNNAVLNNSDMDMHKITSCPGKRYILKP